MSCGFDREIIQRYADNNIDPLELIFLKEHINYCGGCRKELELVMALESELDNIFDEDFDLKNLDILVTKIVDDCMSQLNKREKLKYLLGKSMKTGKTVVNDTVRLAGHIPGMRYLGKGVRKTGSIAGNMLISIVKRKVEKLIADLR